MTKTEFSKITAAIKTYYPKDNPFPNAEAMQLWYEEFKDLPYENVVIALRRHVNTSRWCPTIAELKEAIVVNVAGDQDWGAAWKECMKAVHKYGHRNIPAALESMSPLAREAAEKVGFMAICMSNDVSIERASFRKAYEQIAQNEYNKAALPRELQDKIALIGSGMLQLEEET